MKHAAFAIAAALVACSGCRHLAAQEDVPALLVNPTDATRAELVETLSAALGGAPVTLAADALTQNSILIIDRAPPRQPRSQPLTGRTVEITAERFQLVYNAGQCALVRAQDGSRLPLATARCVPE